MRNFMFSLSLIRDVKFKFDFELKNGRTATVGKNRYPSGCPMHSKLVLPPLTMG